MDQADCASPAEGYQPGSLPEVFHLIGQVDRKLKQIERQAISQAGLTPSQYFVLTLLWECDGRPFKELAAILGCTRATMTGIVDTLEGKGLVARRPNKHDRRSLLVGLTASGRALQDSTPSLDKIFCSCCLGLKPNEARQLSRLLRRLDASLAGQT